MRWLFIPAVFLIASLLIPQPGHATPLVFCPLENDLQADPASLSIRFAPTRGSVVLTNNGCIAYTPDAALSSAVDSLTYRVCQLGNPGNCKESSVEIHIGGASTSFANNDIYVLPAWTSGSQPVYTHAVLANDLQTDAATLAGVFAPLSGTATVSGGQVQYRPAFGYTGYADSLLAVDGNNGEAHTFVIRWYIGEPNRFEVHQDRFWFPAFDSDNDGLPDHGELQYAASLALLNASGDADGDGVSDGDEFVAGTDPTDPLSFPRISAMVFDRTIPGFRLTVESGANGRFHTLYREPELNGASWTTAAGSSSNLELLFTDVGSAPARFFRVRLMPP